MGYGVVGGGVYEILSAMGAEAEVKYVLARHERSELGARFTRDFDKIVSDAAISTVVELIGGEAPAYDYIASALRHGKNVVTANKLVMAKHYGELLRLADENGVDLRFSASVGGGIPWLRNLIEAAQINRITKLRGTMNGTCNFILDEMTRCGADFSAALKSAQSLGFAEADPTRDIDGLDTASKLAVSMNIAFSCETGDIAVCGIRGVTLADIEQFKKLGRCCKLIGAAEHAEDGAISAVVEPWLLSAESLETSVAGSGNLLSYEGEWCGVQSFCGAGAGNYPTANNVICDILAVSRGDGLYKRLSGGVRTLSRPNIDNSRHLRSYYINSSARGETGLPPCARALENGAYISEPVSAKEMHFAAKKIKSEGGDVFFAAVL